jgi:hypothetical protein
VAEASAATALRIIWILKIACVPLGDILFVGCACLMHLTAGGGGGAGKLEHTPGWV